MRLTLLSLLAYLEDALEPSEAKEIGRKIAESDAAQQLVARIRQVTRRRRLTTPEMSSSPDIAVDPNIVAGYLDRELDDEGIAQLEKLCFESDVNLAEVAACQQILTLVGSQPAKVPPIARQRMYGLVEGKASSRRRVPRSTAVSVSADGGYEDEDEALLLGLPAYGQNQSLRQRLAYVAAATLLISGLATILYFIMRSPENIRPLAGGSRGTSLAISSPPGKPSRPASPSKPTVPSVDPEEFAKLLARLEETHQQLAKLFPPTPPNLGTPNFPKHFIQLGVLPSATPDPFHGFVLAVRDSIPDKLPEPPPISDASRLPVELAIYVSKEARESLVLRQTDDKDLRRLRPVRQEKIHGGETILTLPGYRGEFELPSGVQVETVGNFYRPEVPLNRVLESAIEFHPHHTLGLDCTLHRGRAVMFGRPDRDTHIRVRFADRAVDIWILKQGGAVSIELQPRLVRGRNDWTPNLYFSLMTVDCDIELRRAVRSPQSPRGWTLDKPQRIPAGALYTWDLQSDTPILVRDAGEGVMPWANKKNPLADEVKSATLSFEDRVRKQLEKGGGKEASELRDSFFRALNAAQSTPMERRLAIYSLAAIDHLKPVIVAMDTERERADVRLTGLNTLWHWLARDTKQHETLQTFLKDTEFDAADCDLYLQLIRGWLMLDHESTAAILKGLGHKKSLAIRDLALVNLRDLAPDLLKEIPYNPAGDPEAIERAVARLRQRLTKP